MHIMSKTINHEKLCLKIVYSDIIEVADSESDLSLCNKKSLVLRIFARGVPRFWLGGGEASDKSSNKVARISVRGGDIQQKFTQQRHLKNFENLYKIRTKI